jgi:hypothetical protein
MSLLSILLNVSRICMQYKTTHILFWTNYSFQIVLCAVTCMIHKIKDCCAKPIAQFTNHEQLPWPKASSTPLSCLDDGSLSKSRSDQHVIQQRAFQRIVDHCERSDGNKMIRLTIHRVVRQTLTLSSNPSSVHLMAIILNAFMAAWLLINYTATRKAKIDVKMAQVRARLSCTLYSCCHNHCLILSCQQMHTSLDATPNVRPVVVIPVRVVCLVTVSVWELLVVLLSYLT